MKPDSVIVTALRIDYARSVFSLYRSSLRTNEKTRLKYSQETHASAMTEEKCRTIRGIMIESAISDASVSRKLKAIAPAQSERDNNSRELCEWRTTESLTSQVLHICKIHAISSERMDIPARYVYKKIHLRWQGTINGNKAGWGRRAARPPHYIFISLARVSSGSPMIKSAIIAPRGRSYLAPWHRLPTHERRRVTDVWMCTHARSCARDTHR